MFPPMHEIVMDAGPSQANALRQRSCAATGTVRPVEELIRFVAGPDGAVVPDIKRRLPGRGVWITSTRQTLQMAVARNVFARSLRREVRAADDLVVQTEQLLEKSALDALAMCRKAGRTAIGFAKVDAAVSGARVVAVLHATEAAGGGIEKLAAALHRRADARRVSVFHSLSSAQLDLALGRSNVIHAALLAGPESDTFVTRVARLERFRTGLGSGAMASSELRIRDEAGRCPAASSDGQT
jgi:uncharacterized protein